MNYFKPVFLFLFAILIAFTGCRKSHFKRKIEGIYTGTCISRWEVNGVMKDSTYTATVEVAWQDDAPQGKNIFTIVSRDINASAWFRYDPGREGDKFYGGGGAYAGYYQRTPTIIASFHPKEDMLVCTVTHNVYGGKTTTYDFTGKR